MSLTNSSEKKAEDAILEYIPVANKLYRSDVDVSGVDERKLMWKIDMHVIPWLALLYLFCFLDRGNIGNAKLYNLEQDLHITDKQFLITLTVYFFPYALFEPASNVVLKRFRPSRWLSFLVLSWGVIMTCHGFARNYGDLLTLRLLLGLAEAGLYPGIIFYISCWYKRTELGTRNAAFFSSATIAGAFSGLLAAAISKMNGIGGKAGWAWIFIIEGLCTILLAIASFWIIEDFPESAQFLSEAERVFAIRRLRADFQFSAGGEPLKAKYIWQSLTDWKTYLAIGIWTGFDGPVFAFSLFTPTIISQLGFEATAANLLSVPVYVWGCIVTCAIGLLGDRIGSRGYINLGLFGSGLVAYIILISSTNAALSYFAVYLASSSIYPTIPNSVAWVSSNIEGSYKRSVALGITIGLGNIHGAVSSNIYRADDAPRYRLGHGVLLAYISVGIISSLAFMILLRRENTRRENGERDEVIDELLDEADRNTDFNAQALKNGRYETVEAARRDKGDAWSGFRYTL